MTAFTSDEDTLNFFWIQSEKEKKKRFRKTLKFQLQSTTQAYSMLKLNLALWCHQMFGVSIHTAPSSFVMAYWSGLMAMNISSKKS